MKRLKILVYMVTFLMIGGFTYAQERTDENEKVDDEKVLKEAKKEQEKYEKEHGKATPKNRQDTTPEPKVKPNDQLAKDKGKSDDGDDVKGSDDDGMGKDKNKGLAKGHDKKNAENEAALEKTNKGNAYGKDKGDLSGREFGQARAAEARNKIQSMEGEFDNRQLFVKKSQDRIQHAKNRLAEDSASDKFTEEELAAREAQIAIAEQRLDELKQSIINARTRLKTQKDDLVKIYDVDNGDDDN